MSCALADERSRQVRQVRDVDLGAQLAVGLGAGEELGEHVRVDVGGSALGEDAVFVPVALEDGLDDEVARIAGHRPLERRQRGRDDRLDVVGLGEQSVNGAVCRLGRHDADLEEHVLLAGEVEVEQRLADTPAAVQMSATVVVA